MTIRTKAIALGDDAVAYFACPAHRPDAPGVVLLSEIWGLDPHVRAVADRLAAAGHAVLAPDLLGMAVTVPPEAVIAGFRALQAVPPEDLAAPERVAEAMADVPADARAEVLALMDAAFAAGGPKGLAQVGQAVAWLRAQGSPKVGVVGFGLGGRIAFAYAYAGGDADAFAPFYGALPPDPDPAMVRAPVEGHFGAEDLGIPILPLKAAAAALEARDVDAAIHVYADAPHAFFNDTSTAYRPEAAELAWERLLDFLGWALEA